MKHLFSFFILSLFTVFLTGCDSGNSLPGDITSLEFGCASGSEGLNISANLKLSRAASDPSNRTTGVYSGTFTVNNIHATPSSCTLTVSMTAEQSTALDGYLNASKYCSKTNEISGADCGGGSLTVNGSLIIEKSENACAGSEYNYFCAGGDDIYAYLKTIVAAHQNISTCPDTWEDLFL